MFYHKKKNVLLSFSLDENIPNKLNENKIQTVESFYGQLLQHAKHLSQQEQNQLKSKVRRTCENYTQIKTPYKYKKIIENLSNNKNIIVLKQNKGWGVVILNRKLKENYNEYFEVLRVYLLKNV